MRGVMSERWTALPPPAPASHARTAAAHPRAAALEGDAARHARRSKAWCARTGMRARRWAQWRLGWPWWTAATGGASGWVARGVRHAG